MSVEFENRVMMDKIKKHFNIISTVQIIFIFLTIPVLPPVSILQIILFVLMSKKNKTSVIINTVGNILIFLVLSIFCGVKIFKGDLIPVFCNIAILLRFIYGVMIGSIIVSLIIIFLCVRAFAYEKELQFLKKLDGYPYFFDKEDNASPNYHKNIPQYKAVNVEIKSFENSDVYVYGISAVKEIFHSLFRERITDCVGYAKITAMFIFVINIIDKIVFSDNLALLNAVMELVLLIILLVHPTSNKLILGAQIHVIAVIILTGAAIAGIFNGILLIVSFIQIILYFAAYKKYCGIEEENMQRFRESFAEKEQDNDDEYVECNGVYKKKLHVELKKESNLNSDNQKKG